MAVNGAERRFRYEIACFRLVPIAVVRGQCNRIVGFECEGPGDRFRRHSRRPSIPGSRIDGEPSDAVVPWVADIEEIDATT